MTTKKLTPQQDDYKSKGAALAKLNEEVNKAASRAAEDLIRNNPEYAGLSVMPLNRAYIQGPKGITKVIEALADAIAQDRTGKKTQVEITALVQKRFPDFPIQKGIWQKQLSPALFRKVEQRISGNMVRPVSIKGCKTLAQVKKRVKASIESAAALRVYSAKISVSRETVTANDKSYAVQGKGKDLYIRVPMGNRDKRQRMRLDALVSLLSS